MAFVRRYQRKLLISFKDSDVMEIKRIATKEDLSMASVVRQLVKKGLQRVKP